MANSLGEGVYPSYAKSDKMKSQSHQWGNWLSPKAVGNCEGKAILPSQAIYVDPVGALEPELVPPKGIISNLVTL